MPLAASEKCLHLHLPCKSLMSLSHSQSLYFIHIPRTKGVQEMQILVFYTCDLQRTQQGVASITKHQVTTLHPIIIYFSDSLISPLFSFIVVKEKDFYTEMPQKKRYWRQHYCYCYFKYEGFYIQM